MSKEKMNIEYHSGIYTLTVYQELPISLTEAWKFFSQPKNLAEITPSHMGFHITSSNMATMYEGQIITYRIGLFPGIKSNWITEITRVKPMEYFIDEQRFGPYRMWHHEHHFKETEQGTLMSDRVSYKLPLRLAGRLAHAIFIKKQLHQIFTYRFNKLQEMFHSKTK